VAFFALALRALRNLATRRAFSSWLKAPAIWRVKTFIGSSVLGQGRRRRQSAHDAALDQGEDAKFLGENITGEALISSRSRSGRRYSRSDQQRGKAWNGSDSIPPFTAGS